MKRVFFKKKRVLNMLTILTIFVSINACDKTSLNIDNDKNNSNNIQQQRTEKSTTVSILNSGFESKFSNWTDIDPSAISSDAHSGSKSAKITGSGGEVSQTVTIDQNTDYSLSAYVKGSWRIGVYIDGQKVSRSGYTSSWKKETVNFNSSSASSAKVFAQYKSGTGRYDDFELISSGTSTSSSSTGRYPSDIIPELTQWKVTLPVDENGDDSSDETSYKKRNTDAWEIYDLNDFEYKPYFYADDNEVVFRAHCAGATTSGSKYPRSELRQLVGGGDNYWSVYKHQYLQVELRVTHTPVEKPEVCMTQIHGPENEPLRIQYHAEKGLYLVWNEDNKKYFSDDVPYSLGQSLRITVDVNNGVISCTVLNLDNNKSYSYSWTSNDSTGYFKVGCYTQSSIFLSQFKSGYDDEPMDAYGEVRVSKIDLTETY